MKLKSIATNHSVLFAICATIAWFVLELVLTAIASGVLRRPYGDAVTTTLSRLVTTACILYLIWRMGWLDGSGITRSGRWQAWLIGLGGLVYFTCASLYSFYGEVVFNSSTLIRSSASLTTVMTHFVVGLSEEILFRGLVLYCLARVWGGTQKGMIGSVVLTSLLFAVLHLSHVFTSGASLSSALLLIVEAGIVSIWWGALVIWGKTIWPAVMLHFIVNAVVGVQNLTTPMIEPDILVYQRLLWFSTLLGVLGIGLLARTDSHQIVPKVP